MWRMLFATRGLGKNIFVVLSLRLDIMCNYLHVKLKVLDDPSGHLHGMIQRMSVTTDTTISGI